MALQAFNYTPPAAVGTNELADTFIEYARLSKRLKGMVAHRGVVVLQEQVGLPDDATGYIAYDWTVGTIAATLDNPVRPLTVDLNVPGKVHGRPINFDNSLTLPLMGTNYIGAPLTFDIVTPDMATTVDGTCSIELLNIRNSDQGDAATFVFELAYVPDGDVLADDVANIKTIPVAGEISTDGVTWTALTKVVRWDGVNTFTTSLTLASASTMNIYLKLTFTAESVLGNYSISGRINLPNSRGETDVYGRGTDVFELT